MSEEGIFLAFVDEVGKDGDKWLYRFDFTIDPEVVWGMGFNVVPASSVPKMQPDKNSLSHNAIVPFPRKMELAKKNSCYSMQDCIDDIIPLCFSRLDSDALLVDTNTALAFHFGEPLKSVQEKVELFGGYIDLQEIEKGNVSAIDNLIKENPEDGGLDD